MDFLPSGSPSQRGFRYRVLERDSPVIQAPRRSSTSRSSLAPFNYRVVSPRPSISEPGTPSAPDSDGNETELVIPEFEKSEFRDAAPEPASLSRTAKTAAVQALLKTSEASPQLKPLCDRIYARFFQKFGEWSLQRERRRGREVPDDGFDETRVVAARKLLQGLAEEVERWEGADQEVEIPERAPIRVDHEVASADLNAVEKMITALDRVSVRAGEGMASAMIMDERGQEVAREANLSLV